MKKTITLCISIFLFLNTFALNYETIPVFTEEFIRTPDKTMIPLHIDTDAKKYVDDWTVIGGVPIPKGELKNVKNARILNPLKQEISFQVRPLAWWEGKQSVKWLEVCFKIKMNEVNPVYYLEYGPQIIAKEFKSINVKETQERIEIDTGPLKAKISKTNGSLLEHLILDDKKQILKSPITSYIELRDIEGDRSGNYLTILDNQAKVKIEQSGAECVVVLIQTKHVSEDGKKTFPVDVRLSFFRGQSRIKLFHTFYISENPSVVLIPTLGVDIPLNFSGKASVGMDQKTVDIENGFTLWQDSSEIPTFPKCNQFAPFCKIFGGTTRIAPLVTEGAKADGWVAITGQKDKLTVFLRRMWQEFPKGIQYVDNHLKIEFWPSIKPDPMDLRRIDQRFPDDYELFKSGESKTMRGYKYNMKVYHREMSKYKELICSAIGRAKSHEIWLDFSSTDSDSAQIACDLDRPLLPFVSPAWNRFTNVLGAFHPEDKKNFPKIEKSWETYWDTLVNHQTKWHNWYGMFNWGDFQTNYRPNEDRWEYYNTKYGWRNGGMDIPYSIFLWYLRSGKRKYFDLAEITSLHLMDISCKHPKAWADGRLIPPNCSGGGSSRYDKNHWGSGGGYDPEHCFSHSVQMNWLVTGNTHARDILMKWAENYYKREKAFNCKKTTDKDLHYHGRESDMPSKLAANAYENDPLDPRWQEMLDFYLDAQAESFLSMYVNEAGLPMRSCNKVQVLTFYYILYKVSAINYLLTVKDSPQLVEACKYGIPLRYHDESGGGLSYHLLYLMTGNINYAKFAARQAARQDLLNHDTPSKNIKLIPHTMGGMWATYPGLLESVVKADLEISPENYDERELNYYPLPVKGPDNHPASDLIKFTPLDIGKICNRHAVDDLEKNDISKKPKKSDKSEEIIFDFGPPTRKAAGALPVTKDSHYPCSGEIKRGFTALPFGTTAFFNNIPFKLPAIASNNNGEILEIKDGESYSIPTKMKAKRIYLLTGIAFSEDPFHEGAGATIIVSYKDGEKDTFDLINMKHYQFEEFKRLYFSRKFYAGRLTGYSLSVVGVDVLNKEIETISLKDTGKKARLAIFAVTAENSETRKRDMVSTEIVEQKSKDKIIYKKKLPDGLYNVAIDLSMSEPIGSPLDIYIQNNLIVNHAIPVSRTTYEFPVEITKEELIIELLPSEIHHKARATEGEIHLHEVNISRLTSTDSHDAIKHLPASDKSMLYGWKLRGERAVIRDKMGSSYKEKEQCEDNEKLLTWDAGYIDQFGIGQAEFLVDLPNGDYEIELTLMINAGSGVATNVDVDIEGYRSQVRLPKFQAADFRQFIPRHSVVKENIHITDGQLNVKVALAPKDIRNRFDSCGISSLKIKPLQKSSQ